MEWAFGWESDEKVVKFLTEEVGQINDYKVCWSWGPALNKLEPKKVALKK